MANLLAIEISHSEATLVRAEISPENGIDLVGIEKIPTEGLTISESDSTSTEEDQLQDGGDDQINGLPTPAIIQEYDEALAVLGGESVLYRRLELPFRDQKKVDQVVPAQLQDAVPFEIESFVIDNIVLGKKSNNSYRILSSMAQSTAVTHTLQSIAKLGADPVVLTTKPSALAALAELALQETEGLIGVIGFSGDSCSFVALADGEPIALREFPVESHKEPLGATLISALQCSISQSEELNAQQMHSLYVIAPRGGSLRVCSNPYRPG